MQERAEQSSSYKYIQQGMIQQFISRLELLLPQSQAQRTKFILIQYIGVSTLLYQQINYRQLISLHRIMQKGPSSIIFVVQTKLMVAKVAQKSLKTNLFLLFIGYFY